MSLDTNAYMVEHLIADISVRASLLVQNYDNHYHGNIRNLPPRSGLWLLSRGIPNLLII